MKIKPQIIYLLLAAAACAAATGKEFVLKVSDARISGPAIRKTDTIGYWKNGAAEWTLETDRPLENINLMLEYAAPDRGYIRSKARLSIPGVVDKMFSVKLTRTWNDFNFLKIAGFSLPKGTHTLSISYEGPGDFIKLNRLLLTQKPPGYFNDEYPPLFVQKNSWAETMTSMRNAYRDKGVHNSYTNSHLNQLDGKAFWAAFPKESDWFLQDNQVHGEWGAGTYDARKDYKHYLDPDRDNTLEQKLIGSVLEELVGHASRIRECVSQGIETEHKLSEYRDAQRGFRDESNDRREWQPCPTNDLKNELERLIAEKISPDDPAWLNLYVKACGIRRQQRLAPLLKETQQIIYATHMNMGIIYLETETQGCPDGSQLRIIDLTPEANGDPLKDELLFDSSNGIVRDPELSFDGKKLLFAWRKTNRAISTRGKVAPATGNYKIYEMDLATRGLRQLTDDTTYGADFEPCYLPDGNIMFSSARCVHEVTCGWGDASNLYVMDPNGRYARRVGEQYTYPYPFSENSLLVSFSPIGAYLTSADGKLVEKNEQGNMLYKLYYMTLDGRRELLAAHPELSCTQAVPVRPRPVPPAHPSLVDYTKDTGICYVQDVYYGPSAEGIQPGSIKKLRVVQLHYKPATIGAGGWSPPRERVGPGRKYAGYGWHSVLPAGVGSATFDAKTILGEVDVHADGSAMFEVPARTPLYFQLIDKDGLVVQTMRSWSTLMSNETFSCVGCHEENDSAPLPQASRSIAMQGTPQKLQPLHDISGAPFSYPKFVQPIWDEHCVSCHAPGKKAKEIDLSNTLISDNEKDRGTKSTRRKFNQSYLTLLNVKWEDYSKGRRLDQGRPNEWVDYYTRMATVELTPPYYAGSTQSGLIRMLKKGHGKTNLSRREIDTVAAWIDLNVPYVGEYDEMIIWDDEAKELYKTKSGMRRKMEAIEAENISRYISEVQKQ